MRSVLQADLGDRKVIGQEIELPVARRTQTAIDIDHHLKCGAFDALMMDLSGRLDSQSGSRLSNNVMWGMKSLADIVGADRVSFVELSSPPDGGSVLYSHRRPRRKIKKLVSCRRITWLCAELKQGRAQILTKPGDLPSEAAADLASFEADRITNCIAVPLKPSDETAFALICEAVGREAGWTTDTLNHIGLIGDIIVNAIQRFRANQTIVELRGRLVEAQERERRRIARELHDDVNQRMAHLCLDLIRLKSECENGAIDVSEVAEELANRTRHLSSDIGKICHDLYPSRLDHVEFIPSLRGLCRDFTSRYNLDVRFHDRLNCQKVSSGTAFSLYRIAQEALHNVVKHSGSAEAIIEIKDAVQGVEMSVADSGAGFDPDETESDGGLGLNSMRDRLQLIGGRLWIETGPTQGTRLEVWVPAAASAH